MADLRFFAAATTADVEPGEVFVTEIENVRVVICNFDGTYYAIEDTCSHEGSSFDDADLFEEEISCPRHGAIFDVRTGEALGAPADLPVATYEVRVNGNTIEVGLPR